MDSRCCLMIWIYLHVEPFWRFRTSLKQNIHYGSHTAWYRPLLDPLSIPFNAHGYIGHWFRAKHCPSVSSTPILETFCVSKLHNSSAEDSSRCVLKILSDALLRIQLQNSVNKTTCCVAVYFSITVFIETRYINHHVSLTCYIDQTVSFTKDKIPLLESTMNEIKIQ